MAAFGIGMVAEEQQHLKTMPSIGKESFCGTERVMHAI